MAASPASRGRSSSLSTVVAGDCSSSAAALRRRSGRASAKPGRADVKSPGPQGRGSCDAITSRGAARGLRRQGAGRGESPPSVCHHDSRPGARDAHVPRNSGARPARRWGRDLARKQVCVAGQEFFKVATCMRFVTAATRPTGGVPSRRGWPGGLSVRPAARTACARVVVLARLRLSTPCEHRARLERRGLTRRVAPQLCLLPTAATPSPPLNHVPPPSGTRAG